MTKPIAYSYIRFSTLDQLNGDSLRRQSEDSQKWAEENGYTLDSSLKDLGVSAFKGKNKSEGALARFLTQIEAGKITKGSVLIIESLDRLSRETPLNAFKLLAGILQSGINVVSLVDGNYYSEDSINELGTLVTSLVTMSRAHMESDHKSKRIGAAWENKRKQAKENKTPISKKCPCWLNLSKDRSSYVIDSKRAKIVKQMFDLTINGYGKRKIASYLNEKKIKNWGRGIGWRESYISKILKNRAVLGELQLFKNSNGKRTPEGEPISNYYPVIIDENIFYQAQEMIDSRKNKGGRRGVGFSNLFAGMCRCADCNNNMVYINKGNTPKGGKYLVCDTNLRKAGCKNKNKIRYDLFEKFILFNLSPNLYWQKDLSVDSNELKETETTLITLNEKLKKVQEKIKRYQVFFEDDDISEEELINITKPLKEFNKNEIELKNEIKEAYKNNKILLSKQKSSKGEIELLFDVLEKLYKENDETNLYSIRAKVNQLFHKLNIIFYFSSTDGTETHGIEEPYFFIGENIKELNKYSTNAYDDNPYTSLELSPYLISYSKDRYLETIKNESLNDVNLDLNEFKKRLVSNTIAVEGVS